MIGLFSTSKCIVDADQEDWVVEQLDWLEEHLGFPDSPVSLVTPTESYFTPPPDSGHERAQHIFEEVRALMGLGEWPCELQAQDGDINPLLNDSLIVQNVPRTPLGTFRANPGADNAVVITYNPDSLRNPHSLIATFAHELSHYVLACCSAPRLQEDDEEHLTDLFAIASGFGIFLANSKFNFQQFGDSISHGWQTSTSGYMTEHEIVFAFVLFMRRNQHDPIIAKPYLKDHLYSLLKKADRYSRKPSGKAERHPSQ